MFLNDITILSFIVTSIFSNSFLNDNSKSDYQAKFEQNEIALERSFEDEDSDINQFTQINLHNQFLKESNRLQELLNSFEIEDEDYSKTERLLSQTNRFLSHYDENDTISISELSQNSRNGRSIPNDTYVEIVLGIFIFFHYDLSYELLVHSFDDNIDPTYIPVHRNRVFQSDLTYMIANDIYTNDIDFVANHSELINQYIVNGGLVYPQIGNRYEEDLRNAIHAFKFTKPSSTSKQVTITDRYDYEQGGAYVLEQNVINHLYQLQQDGILHNYDIEITYDFTRILRIKTVDNTNNVWTIQVANPTSERIDFIYNKKMCDLSDAKNWTYLTHVTYHQVNAGSSTTVTISTNGTATSVSFSFFYLQTKYVVYGDGLNSNGMLDMNFNYFTQTYPTNNIRLMGKYENKWLIKLENHTPYYELVEYNTKMCNYSDAQNWTNLFDLTEIYISPQSFNYIYITENGTSTSIAVTISGTIYHYSYYANQLNTNGTMSLGIISRNSRIRIQNMGKSGNKWNIKIKNPSNTTRTVYYNSKMCFQGDAQNWTNLNNVVSVQIAAYSSTTVQISENWFAGYIAVSYIPYSGARYITYANELNINTSIHMYWNNI